MKKVSLLCISLLMFGLAAVAQPTQITLVDFESGIPSSWSVSSGSNVQAVTSLASRGNQSVRIKNSTSGIVTLTSPLYTRNAGCNVRLEFSHIPMLKNADGAGQIEISFDNGTTWVPLSNSTTPTSPNSYDASYGGGISTSWNGLFTCTGYWSGNLNIPEEVLDNSYWRHEIFYLNKAFAESSNGSNSFKIRFKVNSCVASSIYSGWFIDDFSICQASTAGNTVRVPQLRSLPESPSIYNYPNCNDVKIVAQIQFLQSAPPPVNDSIYIEYLLGSQTSPSKATMTYDATANPPVYIGYIPFSGFDTVNKWRIVINDQKYNRLTYPFVLGKWNEFRSVRGYVGEQPMQTTGLSSQELMVKTNAVRAMYQFRYRGSELRALGITPGKISGLVYNVTQATPGYTMLGFNTYIANIDSSYVLPISTQYPGDLTQVIGPGFNLVSPQIGWQVLNFDRLFLWDGVSDLLIKVCWDNPNGAVGGTTKIESIAAPGTSGSIPSATTGQFYQASGYTQACTAQFNTADGQVSYRPNFKFRFVRDCQLPIDAGIDSALQTPSNYIVQANTTINPFVVKINNYGSLPLNTVKVKYKIDNLATQDAGTYTGIIPPLGHTNYQLQSNIPSFTPGYRYMKVWSEILPPDIDWEPNNDTAYYEIISCNGPMNGEYAIGNVTGFTADRKFNSFKEVFKMLQGCGVSGPVTFKVLNLAIGQYYTDTLSFPTTIAGASTTNYIKFVSASTTNSVNIKPIKVVNSNVNLSGCKYYKFENLSFYSADACVNDTICGQANLIQMSNTTSNIEFKKCSFVKNPNGLRPTYFVNIGSANNINLDSCKLEGDASSQIYIKGLSSNSLSNNITIKNSSFINNLETAIYAEYSQNITIDKNTFKNNRTIPANSTYDVLIQSSKDYQITKNIFELTNVSAINISDLLTSTNSSIIANNKISVHNGHTGGTTNVYGINVTSGDNILIAYNNIYARDISYSVVSYGMKLGLENGPSLTNVRIKNNVVVSDGYGYAIYARPTTQTSLDFSNNIYWKLGTMVSTPSNVLWKYNSTNCTTLASWQTALGNGDQNSYVENPIFAAWNLLNTSNTFLCYKGTQLTEVTNDFNYTLRPTVDNPCIGAVQFNPPPSNIFVQKVWIERGEESIAADGKTRYSACGLGNEYLNIRFTNISSNSISANNLQLWFKVDNLSVTAAQKDTIHYIIQPNTVYNYRFRLPYDFSSPTVDRDFKITAFSVLTADTVRSNDTVGCYILSRQQLTALPALNNTINYGDSILLSVNSNDSIYWFFNISDATPIKKSHFYQTSRLFNDTTFYFSRKEEIPLLKISEIQISRTSTAAGLTANLPSWATATNTIEISNYGNGAINLKGYQFAYFIGTRGTTDTLNKTITKSAVFGDYILPANKSVVLQIANATSSDSSQYINIGTGTSFNATSKVGFILKDTVTNNIIDAVIMNNAKFDSSMHIPSTVWIGRGITIPSGVAGLIRINNNATDTNGWVASSSTNLMTIGTLDSTQIWKRDNGCYGFMSPYNVHVSGIPSVDPGVASVKLIGINGSAVCTLTDEQVQVRVINTGVQACSSTPLVLNVYDGITLVTTLYDTCFTTIQPNDTATFIFSNTVNLAANTANKIFTIKCFSNLASDVMHLNDTASMQITSLKTPLSPLASDVTIPYAASTTLTAAINGGNTSDALIWYNSPTSLIELDRTNYTTPILYTTDTFYVGTMIIGYDTIQIGTATTSNAPGAYPCPLNSATKNVKEQYLFKASELSNLGFTEGNINSLMFNILSVSRIDTLNNYTIKIGYTNQESLSTWQYGLTEVYFDTLYLSNASDQLGWKTFPFSEPFYYDGHSNIVVEICFSSESTTPRVCTYYTATSFNSVLSYRHATTNACSWTGAPISGGNTNRPNIKFDIDKFGCSSVRKPVVVTVGDPPSCDASITQIISPASTTVMSGIPIPIQVELKNYGTAPLTSTDIAWVVNGITQITFNWTGNLASGASTTVTVGNKIFVSGNNNIKAWSILACDTIHYNDTTSFNFSSCIGNNTTTSHLTIGGVTADFPTINSAVTALINSGICGDVVFDINPMYGGYNEQVFIPSIVGTENGSTITFRGNATDSNSVILKYNAGTNTDKFALKLDGASNIRFENLTIQNYDSTYSSIVEIANNSSNIKFESVVIRSNSLPTPAQEVAKLININGANNNLLFNKVYFLGGATGLNANLPTDTVSNYITITNSFFNYFAFNGISIEGANNIKIEKNKFREYANGNISRAIYTSNLYGLIEILSNNIYLEGGTAVRLGIDVRKVYASLFSPALIANNSISLNGVTTGSIAYVGMNLDTLNNGNIYYNTIKVRATNNSSASKVLNVGGACSNIKVLNNNLDNAGKGFAYYVNMPTTQVTSSNNNNYNTNGVIPIYWAGNKATLALLQTANSQDNLSIIASNPFINDSLLSLSYPSEIVRSGEPLDDVNSDILGNYRPISPKPTIGAYEYQFSNIDCGPTIILSPLRNIKYVENIPLNVQVKIKNFGLFAMDSVKITAVLKYNADTTNIIQTVSQSFPLNLNSLNFADLTISDPLLPPLHFRSINDSLHLCVYTTLNNDTIRINDTIHTSFLTIPGYNIQTIRTEPITERCQLYRTPVKMTIKNVGENTILPTDSIWLGYQVTGRPDLEVRELLHLPYTDETGTYDSIQKNGQVTYTFLQKANFYPLGLSDTTWKLRTYNSLNKDNVKVNDTSAYITINSRVSPPAPITYDTSIYYGTWAEPWATQINSYPIKWYADSNLADPFYAPSSYAASTKYRTTQLFTDSTFYLRVNLSGSYPCQSYFTPIHVTMLDRNTVDGACIGLDGQGVVEPPEEGWVYMTAADTIKVKVSNYGLTDMQNFNISYSIKMTSPDTSATKIVTEHCSLTIPPNGSKIYKFDSLADFSNPTKTYRIRAWVNVPGDATALNDTSRYWLVRPINGTTVYRPSVAVNSSSLDITRVQISNMDNSSNNSGIAYTNFTESVSPIILFKGIYDSIYIQCDKPSSIEDTSRIGGWVRVFIDWNRNGIFDGSEEVFNDTIVSGLIAKGKINVPSNLISGHSRMRIILWQGHDSTPFTADSSPTAGEVEDYKVLVRDTWNVNAELMRFTEPLEFLNKQKNNVRVILRNTGKTPLSNATIHWTNNDGEENIFNWSGGLTPGARTEVHLADSIIIPTGMNNFKAWVDAAGDSYHINDTIRRSSYIFKTYIIPYNCQFDTTGYDDFYAFNSNPQLPTNCWEFGTPDPSNIVIKEPYSAPNCWKTKLSGKYPINNESILYSPIFDKGIVKPDTLSFMMKRDLSPGSYMYIEYKNWNDEWKRLGLKDDEWGQNWYNGDSNRFVGETGTAVWKKIIYSLDHMSYNLGNTVQFRFVFHSGSTTKDGIAIDNIELRRALRPQDAGVVGIEITPTELPNYGSTYYPKVYVRNYGSEALTRFQACYTAQGMNIPQCESIYDTVINPGDTFIYTFTHGRYVYTETANPFNICAFTRLNPTDLYSDNDSICRQVVIGPLQKDIALLDIVSPSTQVVSNNMIEVEIHIKNWGLDPVTTLPVGYKITGQDEVLETITFSPPLFNNEEYIYRFNTQFHSAYGASNLKVWTGLDGDYYHDNDTLYRRVNATTTTKDLEAKYITIDDYNTDYLGVQLTFANNSSSGIDHITVGYYYNGDKANAVEETYRDNTTVPSGELGHHYFTATLPRANAPYQGICGYVKIDGDNNRSNDTTCVLYMGERDAKSDTIFIEQTSATLSKVQLTARNIGTIGGPITVNAGYVINGNWLNPVIQPFYWKFNEPNSHLINYLTFDQRIPRNDDSIYDIVAWVDYQYDANRSNDTTMIYKVVGYIGLDEVEKTDQFTLNQNVPNPLTSSTTITFNLPKAGSTRFFIVNNMGQLIKSENKFYTEGKHEIQLNNLNLTQGIYYYTMEFEGKRLMKKMIIAR